MEHQCGIPDAGAKYFFKRHNNTSLFYRRDSDVPKCTLLRDVSERFADQCLSAGGYQIGIAGQVFLCPYFSERSVNNMRNSAFSEEMVECHYNGAIIYIPVPLFVRMTYNMQFDDRKYIRYKEGARVYGISEHTFSKLASAADAIYHPNKIALVNIAEFDEYMQYMK